MAKKNPDISLAFIDGILHWSEKQGASWGQVEESFPLSFVDEDDDITWTGLETVASISIEFKDDKICENTRIVGNGSRKVKVKTKNKIETATRSGYTVTVKSADGNTTVSIDPPIEFPPKEPL